MILIVDSFCALFKHNVTYNTVQAAIALRGLGFCELGNSK